MTGTNAGPGSDGLDVDADDVAILGMVINGFSGDGINIASNDNAVEDCIVGVAGNFSTPVPDNVGIFVTGADNVIGTNGQGSNYVQSLAGNWFSHSIEAGIWLSGPGATGNVVGYDDEFDNGQAGVLIDASASGNWIGINTVDGGESHYDYDFIGPSNGAGVVISGAGTTGNVVAGNKIESNGTDGVLIEDGASDNWVGVNPEDGSETALQRNMISGNTNDGVEITGTGTTGNVVAGNYIGTNAAGTAPDANYAGVEIDSGASGNLIGASGANSVDDALERNIISGNLFAGVWMTGAGTDNNVVAGNYIGTDVTGTVAVGNGSQTVTDPLGVVIGGDVVIEDGASNNLVGTSGQSADDAGERNIISGSPASDGVVIYGTGTGGNIVAGDYIGTNAAGTVALGNADDGVLVAETSATNWIGVNAVYGPRDADQGNVLSGNAYAGILLFDCTSQIIAGNLIGTNASGSAGIPNDKGIIIGDASSNLVGTSGQDGSADAIERNVISGNVSGSGVLIETYAAGSLPSPTTTGNVVAGNVIGLDAAGTAALPNGNDGVKIDLGAYGNWVGVNSVYGPENADEGNVISGNPTAGVELNGTGTSDNVVAGNLIGTDVTGEVAIPNYAGVEIDSGASGNLIGASGANSVDDALERNILSGNLFAGVWMTGSGTDNNVVSGNYIGTTVSGDAPLSNGSTYIFITHAQGWGFTVSGGIEISYGASDNLVGTTGHSADDAGQRNIISGSDNDGVDIYGSGTSNNVVAGNYIGTNADGSAAVGNAGWGILIGLISSGWVGVNPVYGSEDADQANVISGNGLGVQLLDSSGVVVAGNLIGTDVSGTLAIPNALGGVLVSDSSSSDLVGTTGQDGADNALERNVISGNDGPGVILGTIYPGGVPGTVTQNVVAGNYIGTNAAGTAALGNTTGIEIISNTSYSGVQLTTTASGNTIGVNSVYGPQNADQGNLISGNSNYGVWITGAGTTGNVLAGNLIGINAAGDAEVANKDGVWIDGGASSNTIGGAAAVARNVISGNASNGVRLNGSGDNDNTIDGNYIGTDVTGEFGVGNGVYGVQVYGSGTSGYDWNNVIGVPGAGNVISDNGFAPMALTYASGTVVQANLMGTNASGTSVIAGTFSDGFQIFDSPDTLVGGATPGTGNVISQGPWDSAYTTIYAANANNPGYFVGGAVWAPPAIDFGNVTSNMGSAGTVVEGNLLGTDITGTVALGNPGFGIAVVDDAGITIGGTDAGAGNIIAGNSQGGIGFLSGYTPGVVDEGSSDNLVEGNYIGVNFESSGNPIAGLGNGGTAFAYPSEEAGIYVNDPADPNQTSFGITIGGTAAGAANIISGNLATGILMNGPGVIGNLVAGNYIGTNLQGTAAVANTGDGVQITGGATSNTIGGLTATPGTGAGNLISGNTGDGVDISGAGTTGNVVAGNLIGTNATGEGALGNGYNGVQIDGGAAFNTIGGTVTAARNVVSGNVGGASNYFGIYLTDAGTDSNVIVGNYVGTDLAGTVALGNGLGGILIDNGASANTIGGTNAADRNLVSGNSLVGISMASSTTNNIAQGNWVGLNAAGTGTIANEAGISFINGASAGDAAIGNVISGNTVAGIYIAPYVYSNVGGSGILVQGNLIGTDPTGTIALGNGGPGVEIGNNSSNNTIGGTAPGTANLISANAGAGVSISGTGTEGNLVLGNLIGTNLQGTAAIANTGDGVLISGGATNNTIGGTGAGAGNVIAFNTGVGVQVGASPTDASTGNAILENSIFANTTLGIGLGSASVVPNDSEGHTGPNLFQDFPVISSVVTANGTTTIDGMMTEAANTTYRIEFFGNPAADPSGYGQGQIVPDLCERDNRWKRHDELLGHDTHPLERWRICERDRDRPGGQYLGVLG